MNAEKKADSPVVDTADKARQEAMEPELPHAVTDWKKAQREAAGVAKWAVTMTKVRIRQVVARTRWQLVTFNGKNGGESVGIVDLLAIRKNHRDPPPGMKRGDAFEIILIQVKGGSAAWPTDDDIIRLRAVAERYRAEHSLLAIWQQGREAQFHELQRSVSGQYDWSKIKDLGSIFR